MSENYENNRSELIKSLILKIIFIIIIVLLILWLIPKVTKEQYPSIDKSQADNRVFSDNINRMKDAATSYFTNDRLPKNVGDEVILSLKDMYDNKLLMEIKDRNNKSCALNSSYIKLTKEEKEYLMKINLECGSEKDYILVHMGCYNYCSSAICEKKSDVLAFADNYLNSDNLKGGSDYKSGKLNTTKKKTVKNKKTVSTTKTKTTTITKVITSIKKTINKVTTVVKDPSDVVDPDEPTAPNDPASPTDPKKSYLYEYVKVTSTTTYKWGPWSSWTSYKDSDNIKSITCTANDFQCLKEVETKKEFEQVGTYTKYYKREREESQKLSSYSAKICKNYNYIVYGNTVYTTSGSISGYNSTTSGSWTKSGSPVEYTTPPADTAKVRYVLVGAEYSNCGDTCVSTPKFKYQKYVYNYSLDNVGTYTSSTNYKVTVTCAQEETKTIPVYANVKVYDVVERQEPAYAYVKYYRTRSRTLDTSNNKDLKWSYYNDTTLLNNGYTYTGNKKEKK